MMRAHHLHTMRAQWVVSNPTTCRAPLRFRAPCTISCMEYKLNKPCVGRDATKEPNRRQQPKRGGRVAPAAALPAALTVPLQQMPAMMAAAATSVEQLPPAYYALYMLATSFGVPLSEDALVLWVGSNVFRGVYGALVPSIAMLAYMFALVVLSDMVTFWLGRALRTGMFAPLQARLFRNNNQMLENATAAITKWSLWIGLVQRFTLGFPLCLACGFLGVGQLRFAVGVFAGSVLTLILQLGGAYLLKDRPALCLSAVAACNAIEFALPLLALGWVALQRVLRGSTPGVLRGNTQQPAAASAAALVPTDSAPSLLSTRSEGLPSHSGGEAAAVLCPALCTAASMPSATQG